MPLSGRADTRQLFRSLPSGYVTKVARSSDFKRNWESKMYVKLPDF